MEYCFELKVMETGAVLGTWGRYRTLPAAKAACTKRVKRLLIELEKFHLRPGIDIRFITV